ncbi:MAG: RNA polymerase factor sigma-32 [Paracoccaceae bacterium]|jgi:RNA polymerase sigma-32 factor|nr:RNA polymerase factor sigma-32 [Paracoccaceae bacterium]MDP7186376.1 RNA polymerase factor sigma-32 [Paracoccaceae bacterium]
MAFDGSLDRGFSRRIMGAELLDAETERDLAIAWRDQRDEAALHRLTTAYLRLAVSMASKFRRYGAPMNDLVQEASFGLMKAAEKFDPDRGVRFSTYAVWWIKASIQDYVMRNWSIVRTGSTSSQKSLFFNFKRVLAKLEREALAAGVDASQDRLLPFVAAELGVPLPDVEMMAGRLTGGDFSLNAPQSADEDGREWLDLIEDEMQGVEQVQTRLDGDTMRDWLLEALQSLNERERLIIRERKLGETARTLESLGAQLQLSKERVRQIETAALQKMRRVLERNGRDIRGFLH